MILDEQDTETHAPEEGWPAHRRAAVARSPSASAWVLGGHPLAGSETDLSTP